MSEELIDSYINLIYRVTLVAAFWWVSAKIVWSKVKVETHADEPMNFGLFVVSPFWGWAIALYEIVKVILVGMILPLLRFFWRATIRPLFKWIDPKVITADKAQAERRSAAFRGRVILSH